MAGRTERRMPKGRNPYRLQSGLRDFLSEFHHVDYTEFMEVADLLSMGYERLVRKGMDGQLVAHAMLGATLNLYDLFDVGMELPRFFRELADYIENEAARSSFQGEV